MRVEKKELKYFLYLAPCLAQCSFWVNLAGWMDGWLDG